MSACLDGNRRWHPSSFILPSGPHTRTHHSRTHTPCLPLRAQVLEEQVARRSDAVVLLEPMLLRTLADVQERLTYRAQTFIREEIAGFTPTPADVDYPARLQPAVAADEAGAEAGPGATEDGAPAALLLPATMEGSGQPESYANWYPPVHRTLLLLSKLYLAVDSQIFTGLAHEAVAASTAGVQEAGRSVTQSHGLIDGQLFAIRQLLVLRERIAPFEADFSVVERDLDFSHMRDYLRRTMSGEGLCG